MRCLSRASSQRKPPLSSWMERNKRLCLTFHTTTSMETALMKRMMKAQVMRMSRLILPSNEPASEHWKGIQLFVKPTERDISHRKLERLQRIGEIRLYYLRNPIRFIEEVFGATLFDYQKYCL